MLTPHLRRAGFHRTLCIIIALLATASLASYAAPNAGATGGVPTSDAHWSWQQPTPQGDNLTATDFVDPLTGWAVGDHGTVLGTVDGGQTWSARHVPDVWDLKAVDFVSPLEGWVGGDGALLHTIDGGLSWTTQLQGRYILSVAFVNALEGWATVATTATPQTGVLHTVDGGVTWQPALMPGTDAHSHFDIACGDADHIVVIAVPESKPWRLRVFVTADGGSTWMRQSVGAVPWPSDVAFSSPTVAWIAAEKGLLRSDDGGQTWTLVPLPGNSPWAHDISFCDPQTGLAIGESRLFRTSDGGSTWTSSRLPGWWPVDAQSVSPTDAVMVGAWGEFSRSTDGGASWTTTTTRATTGKSPVSFTDIAFGDDLHGCAVGDRRVLQTADGGATWTERVTQAGAYGVAFGDTQTAWVVGRHGAVLRSTDAGVSWLKATLPAGLDRADLWSVESVDALHAIVAGYDFRRAKDVILRTTDGGATWKRAWYARMIQSLSFTDALNGWSTAFTYRTPFVAIHHTTDGGATWQRVAAPDQIYSEIEFLDATHGWIATWQGGLVTSTTDGGATWSLTDLDMSRSTEVWSPTFVSASEGWLLAEDPERSDTILLHTRDGGLHWSRQNVGLGSASAWAMAFRPSGEGWIAGDAGAIVHTSDGGGTAPITSASPADETVVTNQPLTVTLSAYDAGSGVARTEYTIERSRKVWTLRELTAPWTTGLTLDFAASADHSADGVYHVRYRSVDLAGAREAIRSKRVVVDTLGPQCFAIRSARCERFERVYLHYAVRDATSWHCSTKVEIRNAGGEIVQTLERKGLGSFRVGFDCDLRPGRYTFEVTASDMAGNPQTVSAHNHLTVF